YFVTIKACRMASAFLGSALLARGYGAQEKPDGSPGLRFQVVAFFQAVTDYKRVREGYHRAHDQFGSLARIDLLEFASLDPVAQDQLDHVSHHVLVGANGAPALLDRSHHELVDPMLGD